MFERNGTTPPSPDWNVLRRFISSGNYDSYRANPHTLAMIEGSYKKRVSWEQAVAALDRLEAEHGG